MESLNPGGTGKDRAALAMLLAAERSGALPPPAVGATMASSPLLLTARGAEERRRPTRNGTSRHDESADDGDDDDALIRRALARSGTGGLVVEGTSGSAGISLAALCRCRGHACLLVMPDDQASAEKRRALASLGAAVRVVPPAAIAHPRHYANVAGRLAGRARTSFPGAAAAVVWTDQFENPANVRTHYEQTGPEIYEQMGGRLDAFVMSSGTGGTIAGVGRYLKERDRNVRVVLVDPPGSSLYHKIQHGVCYAAEQRERSLRRHRYDTLAEGIGLDRVTANLAAGLRYIDEAVRVTDQEAVDMAHYLLKLEGLWVGSSSAMNVVGAVRTALELPPNSTVVTVVCDSGQRHVTRFWNKEFILSRGLTWPEEEEEDRIPECLRDVTSKS
jgi:cysteine synthase A